MRANSAQSKYGLERIFKVVLDLLVVVKFLRRLLRQADLPVRRLWHRVDHSFALSRSFSAIGLRLFLHVSLIQTPLPLLSALLFLVGVMSILLGLIAEMMVRTYYESQGARAYLVRELINFSGDPVQIRPRISMCGIAGFWGAGDQAIVTAMTDALAHRGPDGHGYHIDEDASHFPRSSPPCHHRYRRRRTSRCGTRIKPSRVVFNGEIYNHVELRRRAGSTAVIASTRITRTPKSSCTATRSGAPSCRSASTACSRSRSGTRRSRRLFLARDRFGEKPLLLRQGPRFLRICERAFVVAAPSPGRHARSTSRSLQKLFGYGFFPAPERPTKACSKLPGGHWLLLDLDSPIRSLCGAIGNFRCSRTRPCSSAVKRILPTSSTAC